MNNKVKQFFGNKWVKIGGAVLILGGLTALTIKIARKRKERKDIEEFANEPTQNIDNTIIPNIVGDSDMILPAGFKKYNDTMQYGEDSVRIKTGNKVVTFKFTEDAVIKLQKYFAKNATAKQNIEASGGYDGIVGITFMKILAGVLKNVPDKVSGMRALMKTANVNSI